MICIYALENGSEAGMFVKHVVNMAKEVITIGNGGVVEERDETMEEIMEKAMEDKDKGIEVDDGYSSDDSIIDVSFNDSEEERSKDFDHGFEMGTHYNKNGF